jgi:hypothetical protein
MSPVSYLVLIAGRRRYDPRIVHERIESAIQEAQRLRTLPQNLDRPTHIVKIEATFPAEVPGREARGIRE